MSNSLWPYGLQFSPGSSVQGIFQARILEWVAKPSSRGSSNPGIEPTSHVSRTGRQVLLPLVPPGESLSSVRSGQSLSRVWLFATPWITERQASLSTTNSRSSLKLMSIESVMPSSHLIFCRPLLLLPPILPSIRVFSNDSSTLQLFTWGGHQAYLYPNLFLFTFFPLTESGLPLTELPSLPSSLKAFCLWAGSDGVGGWYSPGSPLLISCEEYTLFIHLWDCKPFKS